MLRFNFLSGGFKRSFVGVAHTKCICPIASTSSWLGNWVKWNIVNCMFLSLTETLLIYISLLTVYDCLNQIRNLMLFKCIVAPHYNKCSFEQPFLLSHIYLTSRDVCRQDIKINFFVFAIKPVEIENRTDTANSWKKDPRKFKQFSQFANIQETLLP